VKKINRFLILIKTMCWMRGTNWIFIYVLYFAVAQLANSGVSHLVVEITTSHAVRYTHTHTQTHPVALLWKNDRFLAEAAKPQHPTNTETNIYVLSGIPTRNPSNEASPDLRLRRYLHRDWYVQYYLHKFLAGKCTKFYTWSPALSLRTPASVDMSQLLPFACQVDRPGV